MKTEVLFPDPYPDTDPDFRKDIYELQQFLIDEVPLSYEVEIIKHPKLKSCIKVTNDQGRERFVKPSKKPRAPLNRLLCYARHEDAGWVEFGSANVMRLILGGML
jgi:hypothetical protein